MAKVKSQLYYEAVGRRKSAVVRVRLYVVTGKEKSILVKGVKISTGEMTVNKKPISTLFSSIEEKVRYLSPLKLTNNEGRFGISIVVKGGGRTGQLDALIHGLARAIEKVDKDQYRPDLKKAGLLTRDPRVRERRKVGTGGRARRQKQSPKR